ncbi:unnamed protein product [Diabrotica balteata]|uniref:DUF7869 domain-containing protein n=1 Tax=Diabrotica balteata TaxID=107213 RepID=A0A9N9SUP2_DIABA|nr:unnamed protein product [Diabrotica balteata]
MELSIPRSDIKDIYAWNVYYAKKIITHLQKKIVFIENEEVVLNLEESISQVRVIVDEDTEIPQKSKSIVLTSLSQKPEGLHFGVVECEESMDIDNPFLNSNKVSRSPPRCPTSEKHIANLQITTMQQPSSNRTLSSEQQSNVNCSTNILLQETESTENQHEQPGNSFLSNHASSSSSYLPSQIYISTPQDSQENQEHEWKTVQAHKRARNDSPGGDKQLKQTIMSDYWLKAPTPTSNRFASLDEVPDETNQTRTDAVKESIQPPPIFVSDVGDIQPLRQLLETISPLGYSIKCLYNDQVKIQPSTSEYYRIITKALNEKKTHYYTYQKKEERTFRVVLHDGEWSDYSASCSEYEPNSKHENSSEVDDPAPCRSNQRTNRSPKEGKTSSSCATMGHGLENMDIPGSSTQISTHIITQNVVYEVNESQHPEVKKGKKRNINKDAWKRTIKSKESFSRKHQRRQITNCRCKCSLKLTEEQQNQIFQAYHNLTSSTQQNLYLEGCVRPTDVKRHRSRKSINPRHRSRSFLYEIKIDGKLITLCQSAFLAVHGIKRSKLRRKIQKNNADPKDSRGIHHTRPNRTKIDTLAAVRKFIEELPARESHYSRSDNKLRKYLDSHLSVAKLHRNFLEKSQNEKVSYEMFRKIFTEEYNISFGFPRKDICKECTLFLARLQQAEVAHDKTSTQTLKVARELHIRKAEVFQKKISEEAKANDPYVLSICLDYQKNLPVPVTNITDEYYLRQLWIHNLGIRCLTTGKTNMYMYAEHFAQKGPNEVISCLQDYITQNQKPEQRYLKLFCDNCFSQNKNRYLFVFLDQLCSNNIFEAIEIWYPIPGHSMMPVDRDFAVIEKQRVKYDKVDNPEVYVNMIKGCRKKNPFDVVFVQHSLRSNGCLEKGDRSIKVKNYKLWLDSHIKKTVPGISKARRIKFSRNEQPQLSATYSGPMELIKLYKVGQNRKVCGQPTLAYANEYLQIKQLKFDNVMHLVKHIISLDTEFFTRTMSDNGSIIQQNNLVSEELHQVQEADAVYE